MMQTLKFEVFPSLILFLDHRDPFFAACLFVPFFHLYRLQSLKKSTSVPDPRLPHLAEPPASQVMQLICCCRGSGGDREGELDPCQGFVK